MSEASSPKPHKPTIDEIVDNSIANMAAEGYVLTEEEKAKVRDKAHAELSERLAKAEPKKTDASG